MVGFGMADLRKRDESSDKEAQRRFEAALRGARAVGHESMKDIPPKRATLRAAMKVGKLKAKAGTKAINSQKAF
jgi:hypothetical protein